MMVADDLAIPLVSTLVLGLRIAPIFAFAPPFTLLRVTLPVRLLLGLGFAATLVGTRGDARLVDLSLMAIVPAAARELALGGVFVLVPQLVFGALALAGRTIDIQAGFGLAVLIDPTTRAQMPLIGTLFAYLAGAIFFVTDGPAQILRLVGASLTAVPLGTWTIWQSLDRLVLFTSTVFSIAIGFAALAIGTLFLIDIMLALLSRTVPQMNVLALGLQVKTLAVLLVLPLMIGGGGTLLLRLLSFGLESLPRLI